MRIRDNSDCRGFRNSRVIQKSVAEFKRQYNNPKLKTRKLIRKVGKKEVKRKCGTLTLPLYWQRDGATAHWSEAEMALLDALGLLASLLRMALPLSRKTRKHGQHAHQT